jgi:hypothetical protein
MSITKETARQCQSPTDDPRLLAIVQLALQRFLNSLAVEGFLLPMQISVHDSDGDILREFRVERGGKIVLGQTADAAAMYVWPLTAVAIDAGGRVAILKLAARGSDEAVAPDVTVEFVN